MNTHTVKPSELQPADHIVSQQWTGPVTVIRVDKVEPGYVRVITHRKGGEFYDMFHPTQSLTIER